MQWRHLLLIRENDVSVAPPSSAGVIVSFSLQDLLSVNSDRQTHDLCYNNLTVKGLSSCAPDGIRWVCFDSLTGHESADIALLLAIIIILMLLLMITVKQMVAEDVVGVVFPQCQDAFSLY